MAHDEHEPAGSEAWDLYGAWLGHAGEVGQAISRRYLQAWTDVSANLRGGPYTPDKMAADSARMWQMALDNTVDACRLWTESPEHQNVADGERPSAFVNLEFVGHSGRGEFTVPNPVLIDLPADLSQPPDAAKVKLTGPDVTTAERLEAALRVRRQDAPPGYLIAPFKHKGWLEPGVYLGLVYVNLGRDKKVIANIGVLVDAPPPTPDMPTGMGRAASRPPESSPPESE